MDIDIRVVGGGLAGSEAALTLARLGLTVELWEMRPLHQTDIHETDRLGELVCSNSLGSDALRDARGLLKAELRLLGSGIVRCADASRLPAGKAFAVDKDQFSSLVTESIQSNPLISIRREEYKRIDSSVPTILATGPLTSPDFLHELRERLGCENLFFYDAVAPSVWAHSVDRNSSFLSSRGGDAADYLNCPLTREEYYAFVHALQSARQHLPETPDEQKYFEGCLPVEEIARRGDDTLRFGPMRPVGLRERPADCFAVIQLRKENREGTVLGLVGFQTSLAVAEQQRVLGMIPALRNAEYVRYGLIHRNAFLRGPSVLSADLQLGAFPHVWAAGQLCGVDGYMESTALGLVAALNAAASLHGFPRPVFSVQTMMGLLVDYVTRDREDFQPTNANYGLLPLEPGPKQKAVDRETFAVVALEHIRQVADQVGAWTAQKMSL
ncbi:methylenetetrahydrofolate--tRNA-(uracil(54)-C(5))-methyltransferase (FADH(2)-oxidizing) TrmFO [Candidatus Cryosericum hinesii]|jgi:methylenetetrahydrofolate--tRNA-(uracil-5-)-methyltransferase|uniref:Methylenetetrahydrofolate--tRNA-(uracil-5-)-methyltransferase TrmFO n=1 Tax=Candidatus Cryosericum hinesii TaxID=2290915 RepID=A0A398DRV0_9BACT|nr:methylenetetrahydrofolate--tRNA-(uracil(54)-C(5))-methyltransferase (FADH(2)-oxidizing) TrmFO [Candidatus Cryosericum hinesii]RIE09698.1 methylenetetrahydrofolate--tRNA-(uracil(54)-C(5))-methyltransferase (FADH(2)-oxidizing) TrmFO [Candidatus Cryosericum hinesii]RIE13401.1 methylenetetrahydrofolate--tRNA-(uracil(54)-C(5))-methyltransferase (FADH(2)-oxidizing) TrmFO [Candidatus Cryosericum hinesii]RIE13561.1 methylenetetrahydrofolate--tRNA-(uracil(54)-C(5))-methyltransferase (FADH(2)-oxidizing